MKVQVPAILTTPKIGGVPHRALEQRIPEEDTVSEEHEEREDAEDARSVEEDTLQNSSFNVQ